MAGRTRFNRHSRNQPKRNLMTLIVNKYLMVHEGDHDVDTGILLQNGDFLDDASEAGT